MFLTFLRPRTEKAPLRMRSGDGHKDGHKDGNATRPLSPNGGGLPTRERQNRPDWSPGRQCLESSAILTQAWVGRVGPPLRWSHLCNPARDLLSGTNRLPTPRFFFLWNIVHLTWRGIHCRAIATLIRLSIELPQE